MNKSQLRESLTPEFLGKLKTAAECYGWSGDLSEVLNFCSWCFDIAGTPVPEFDVDFQMDD